VCVSEYVCAMHTQTQTHILVFEFRLSGVLESIWKLLMTFSLIIISLGFAAKCLAVLINGRQLYSQWL